MNTNTSLSKGLWIQLNQRQAARAGIFLLLLLLTLPAAAQAQFTYTINSGTVTITGYTGPGGLYVTIPDTINGLPVTRIGYAAFESNANVNTFIIPNTVTNIGALAFYNCTKLGSIDIPNGVTSIADETFLGCSGLASVNIPDSVTSIADGAFSECIHLCCISIPNRVTNIGNDAFYDCANLSSLVIGNSVTDIGYYAFAHCANLTAITLPSSVTSIGYRAFYGCTSLIGITVDALNSSYSSMAGVLFDKSQTTLVEYPEGLAGAYKVPSSVTDIGDEAFVECTNLTSIIIPNRVTNIGDAALEGCTYLRGVYFQGNAPSLGANVFASDYNATVYYLPGTTGWGATYGGPPTLLWNPPTTQVSTLRATGVSTNIGTLNGTVNPNGWPTTAWFQWGATTNYGNLTSVTDLGSGVAALPLSAPLAGLTPSVTYHFRIAATNDNGLAYGSDQSFTTAAAHPFTDADWVSLGSGMNNSVYALAVSGTNLYAGGSFTTAGGVSANYIAKWDGSAWAALGSGMNDGVGALAVSGTNLYAGGNFTTAGGVPANYIAKWDGRAWSALGSGMNWYVFALAVSGTNLYAGGADFIAKWDGRAWSALGSGLNGYVYALAVSGTNLYAGGSFTTVGGVTANCIAKWDGSAWSALGSRMSSTVTELAVSGTNLYAGGYFTTAGGVPANNIAEWDGSAWSALGSGMGGSCSYVDALAVSGTDLYAGGAFYAPYGAPGNCIAKWDGIAWSALGSGMNAYVNALAFDGAGHLFVGGDFTLAGTNASHYIAQANLGSAPTVLASPQSQTAEAGATVILSVDAAGDPPPLYQWYSNGTNLLSCANPSLTVTNILFSQSGTYAVVVTNVYGAVTSAPALVNVIPAVERRPVPGVEVMGETASLVNVDYADSLSPAPTWAPLGSVSLTSTPQYCFDLTQPLPPQRFYRAWQTGATGVRPSLDLHLVPAITLTGNIGGSVRLDYINQFGPTDAWVPLATVSLTNTSQLYFDISAPGQPPRLYRLVPSP